MQTKKCTKCGEDKELSAFGNDKKVKSGKKSQCKQCRIADYKENKEKYCSKARKWVEENRKKKNSWQRIYYKKLRDEVSDVYISKLIGIPLSEAPKKLIELKRIQIKILRELKS